MNSKLIINEFLSKNPDFNKIEWEDQDLTIYFKNNPEPFSITEFTINSSTRDLLEQLENDLLNSDGIQDIQLKIQSGIIKLGMTRN